MSEEPKATVSAHSFRRAFRLIPGPVAVVLTRSADGGVKGITCTSVASLSADPPLLNFAVDRKTHFAEEVSVASQFSVNFLSVARQDWARAFATGGRSLTELSSYLVDGRTGVPTLGTGTTAVLECALVAIHEAGDHQLVVGSVWHSRAQSDAPSLVYESGVYGSFAPTTEGVEALSP